MIRFDKLVRDRIPELIEDAGERPVVRILEGEEYLHHLEKKLDEEVEEYHRDKNAEELADILEVVCSLGEARGWSREKLMALCCEKRLARGGFEKGIFLIGKE